MKPESFEEICKRHPHILNELTDAVLCTQPIAYRNNSKGDPVEPLYTERCLLTAARVMAKSSRATAALV